VNGTCHSNHMPSHIYNRAGDWHRAAVADGLSVKAADTFSNMGALKYQPGGDVGTLETFTPGKASWVSGLGFAYNAGNLYHSLEYQQNEVLQGCNRLLAVDQTERMAVAAFQAIAAGGYRTAEVSPDGHSVENLDSAWFYSTTYNGWLYRMQARLSLQDTIWRMLGDVGSTGSKRSLTGATLPLPLAWSGTTDYNNALYAPQSETGLWSAFAMERLLDDVDILVSQSGDHPEADRNLDQWQAICSGETGAPKCTSYIAAMAMQRINEVTAHYNTTGAAYYAEYEGALNYVVGLEVQASQALASGHLQAAAELSQKASNFEVEAVNFIKPTSMSLYYLPGTTFNGALKYRLSSGPWAKARGLTEQFLQEAEESFEECLAPTGRPMLAACSLGLARVRIAQQGESEIVCDPKAKAAYEKLLVVFNGEEHGKPAQHSCSEAYTEAENYVKSCEGEMSR